MVDTYMFGLTHIELLGFLRKTILICFIFFITSLAIILVKMDVCAEHNPEYTISAFWKAVKTRVYSLYFYMMCLIISVFWYIFLTTV